VARYVPRRLLMLVVLSRMPPTLRHWRNCTDRKLTRPAWGALMSTNKARAAVLSFLLPWANPALPASLAFASAVKRSPHVPVKISSSSGSGTAAATVRPVSVLGTPLSLCGIVCDGSDDASPDLTARLNLQYIPYIPFTSFPVFLSARFTYRSFEQEPNWLLRLSSADWSVGGRLEVVLTSNISLRGEVSHTAPTGVSGCPSCLLSGPVSDKYENNVVRASFVLRN
jgi:hypothetical protein